MSGSLSTVGAEGGLVLAKNWNTVEMLQVLGGFFKWNRMTPAKALEDIMFIKLLMI